MSDTATSRTDREDFQATSDPAVLESADRGEVQLLSYSELYQLWERQQWRTQDLDFTQDKLDWESFPDDEKFQRMYGLSDDMLKSRVDKLARDPGDLETLVEAVTLYHMVIEGMLALTGQHFIISYNEENGTLPGFVEGFNNVGRDEHRHVAFGARFLREMAQADTKYAEAIQRMLIESAPAADGVLQPPWYQEGMELFGVTMDETREFAMKALQRRLKVIGLAPVAS